MPADDQPKTTPTGPVHTPRQRALISATSGLDTDTIRRIEHRKTVKQASLERYLDACRTLGISMEPRG